MTATLLYEDRQPFALSGADRNPLRLTLAELARATGWERKPQGLCRGETCVPEPPDAAWYDSSSGEIDLARFAAHLGQPVATDDENRVVAIGAPAARRRDALLSLEAPDFELPDLDGKLHRLSDSRGKKVLLFSWGSY
ncbi:MAG: redoxin domain-containing protein [Deltaproteobacteria bacterium]|nr:redoxin domain-containing protein [Deltaproteobacteria bacterium]